ncbi:uncharacterized protein L3040_001305 [Drepanopeziza brunnea f. sp. 'multigermtubi']|uniref:uncharacterized protein n=1 Tax=Drepanopeziza brunnea f. sp. 'multigermtubi' TaxID=698441 RepID=UPI00238C816A|nr:hypothetical protein L3040_001305 [Drepanopeziza brunnea f. sp. 'multigermtubi']
MHGAEPELTTTSRESESATRCARLSSIQLRRSLRGEAHPRYRTWLRVLGRPNDSSISKAKQSKAKLALALPKTPLPTRTTPRVLLSSNRVPAGQEDAGIRNSSISGQETREERAEAKTTCRDLDDDNNKN